MGDENKLSKGVGTQTAAGTVGGTVGLGMMHAVSDLAMHHPMVAAVFGFLTVASVTKVAENTIVSVQAAWGKRGVRRTEKLIEEFFKAAEGHDRTQASEPTPTAEETIHVTDDYNDKEDLMRSIRTAIDAPDESTIGAMARLLFMNRCRDPSGKADVFFRATVRVLSECDADGLRDMQLTIQDITREFAGVPDTVILSAHTDLTGQGSKFVFTFRDAADLTKAPVFASTKPNSPVRILPPTGREVPGFTRERGAVVVRRLSDIGLPRDEQDTQGVALSREVVRRLAEVLGTPEPPKT